MWKFIDGSVFVWFFWTLLVANIELVYTNVNSPPAQPCDRTRRVFTESYGEISDGPAVNYTQDSHCEWLIKAKNDSQFITLTFQSMGTECSYDYIFVYDGDSFKSPLLGSFSGRTDPQKVVETSGSMLILLYSDTNYVLDGFKAEFYVSNCMNNCSNRGKCIGHQCVCQGDWIGKDCNLHACPDNCGVTKGHGVCSKEHCRCLNGYSGKACSLHNHHPIGNQWHWMSTFQGGLWPRAAHTAVYVNETDSLYVFGGYDLNNVLGALQIYRFNKSTWEDEWGINLRSRHFPKEIDNELIKAVLHEGEDEARLWGLKNDASFFRNILLTISNQNFVPRKIRSPSFRNETPHDLTNFLEEYTDKPRPKDRYGH